MDLRQSQQGEEGQGFTLPGGMGFTPLDFTPGQGKYDRKPLTLTATLQQGYDDNIYSSSGKFAAYPVKGSAMTNAGVGMDLLSYQAARMGLSLGTNLGGIYYWDRKGDQLTPSGGINLLFAYKLTPRAQFSAVLNGLYTNQSSLTVVNGLTEFNGKPYLVFNGKFDLLYQWMPRISTDTTYSIASATHQQTGAGTDNYVNQTLGQSLRYKISSVMIGVVEGRFSHIVYDNSLLDSNTYYILGGFDLTLSRRMSATLRAGDSFRNYDAVGLTSSSAPYAETSLNYALGKRSSISLDGRYGFDDGTSNTPSRKSTRTALNFNQTITNKLRGAVGFGYTHRYASQDFNVIETAEDNVSTTLGFQYLFSPQWTGFGNYNRIQILSSDSNREYTKNTYYLGASYQF